MAQTTNYNFDLPTVGADNDNWGQKLNDNWTATDALLGGSTPVSGIDINGGAIDNTPIGAVIAAAGSFTTIAASGDITGDVVGHVTGNINATDGTKILENGTDGTDAIFYGGATNLRIAREFSVSGDVQTSAGVNFNGSADVDLSVTITDTLWDKIYPVGSIYATTEASFDPNTSFSGTWSTYAAGKVLVGQDAGDTDFDTIGETSGEKTHTLTVDEMPAHNHQQNNRVQSSAMLIQQSHLTTVSSGVCSDLNSTFSTIGTNTYNEGNSDPHNNLQPYVVVKYWLRTA